MRACAASTACAVPRRSRLHENLRPAAATRLASAATASAPGPTTTAVVGRRRPRAPHRAHARAATGRRSRAAPSAATSACACLRRRRARWQGRSAQPINGRSSSDWPRPSYPSAPEAEKHAGDMRVRRTTPVLPVTALDSDLDRYARGPVAPMPAIRYDRRGTWNASTSAPAPIGSGQDGIVRDPCKSRLFLPHRRARPTGSSSSALLALGEALYLRYGDRIRARYRSPARPDSTPGCAQRSGWPSSSTTTRCSAGVALAAALLQPRAAVARARCSVSARGCGAFGMVLHNADLAGLAVALLHPQPGASRACSQSERKRKQAGAEPQRLPIGEALVAGDIDGGRHERSCRERFGRGRAPCRPRLQVAASRSGTAAPVSGANGKSR